MEHVHQNKRITFLMIYPETILQTDPRFLCHFERSNHTPIREHKMNLSDWHKLLYHRCVR